MEPQDYDWPDGCCPKCDCEVGMEVKELPNNIIRYQCPTCGYFEDFDDTPFEGDPPLLPDTLDAFREGWKDVLAGRTYPLEDIGDLFA